MIAQTNDTRYIPPAPFATPLRQQECAENRPNNVRNAEAGRSRTLLSYMRTYGVVVRDRYPAISHSEPDIEQLIELPVQQRIARLHFSESSDNDATATPELARRCSRGGRSRTLTNAKMEVMLSGQPNCAKRNTGGKLDTRHRLYPLPSRCARHRGGCKISGDLIDKPSSNPYFARRAGLFLCSISGHSVAVTVATAC